MGRGRLAIVVLAGLAARGVAAPDGSGSGSGSGSGEGDEIEMEPAGSGSGSGSGSAAKTTTTGSGSATATAPAPAPAPAPDPNAPLPKDPKVAKKWLAAAQTLTQKGDYFAKTNKPTDAKSQYDNAVTAYQKAIEAGDDVSVYLALALVEDKAGTPAAAYKHLKLLVDPKSNAKPDVAKKAQAKLDEITTKVGTLTLTVTPDGTTITLAGKDVGEAPMTEPLILDPGTYTLSFVAVGFQPKEVEFKIEAGSESERKIALEPMKVVVKPVGSDEPDQPAEGPKEPSILPLYVGAGATAGFFLVATITGISAISVHGTYTDPQTTKLDRKDAQSSGRTLAHVTDACLVGMIAAGAFTTYWYVYKWAPEMKAQGKDHWLLFGPWADAGGGGAFAAGSF
jgi:hypothetical protein